ncbi:hypothetical protein NQ318_005773 [Aromia moschata]|uniref:Uncharacterized protein n=1 Tax=Aromia moschata TaxID=1265417 RepID=A0AAV8YR25_9CUCU|nr:hypothetical protein NQ318_005773 [Aromia moschata]
MLVTMGSKVLETEEIGKTWPQYVAVLSGPVGDLVGSILYPSIVDVLGRKKTILLIAVPQIASMTMIYFSFYSKILLYVARFVGGLSEAACFTILPLYIGENWPKSWIMHQDNALAHDALSAKRYLAARGTPVLEHAPYSPALAPCDFFLFPKIKSALKGTRFESMEEVAEPRVRGTLGSYFSMIMVLGILAVNIIGSYLDIHKAAIVFASLPVLFLLVFSQMPESPYYLIMKSRVADAEASLRKLRAKKNVDAELVSIKADVERQMSEPGRYRDLFEIDSNRKACVVMFSLRVIQQFSGVSAFSLYMQTLFEKSSKTLPKHVASSMIFALQGLVNFLATLIVDKVGRKILLTASCLGCCLTLFFEGAYFLVLDFTGLDVANMDYLPLIGVVVFIVVFTIGQGNVVNLMVTEMFSASVKAKASCLMNVLFAITMTLSTKFFQYTSDTVSMCVPFLAFGVCQLAGTVFCVTYVPETKGKTLEQIQQHLKGNKRSADANGAEKGR